MKGVPILKYTANGNNFVIVDETRRPFLTEKEKSAFAYRATDINYGVGSDNLLIIQPCTPKILRTISGNRGYWNKVPDASKADYIFRMFEPNGVEAFSCANGLMCIANYFGRQYGIESTRIMTEIPTGVPKVVSIGTYADTAMSWANMGIPRRIPPNLVEPSTTTPYDDTIDTIANIEITFRKYDLAPFSDRQSLKISGYLVFTGEPHLVIFSDFGLSLKGLPETIFVTSLRDTPELRKEEKRVTFGSWLVHHIGTYLNREYAHIFPSGINVDFVSFNKKAEVVEYRSFERGIYRETLACGTGALAVSFVARRLNFLDTNPIIAWPHRSRWHEPDAQILVREDESGWILYGSPVPLFEGSFLLQDTVDETRDLQGPEDSPQTRILAEVMV